MRADAPLPTFRTHASGSAAVGALPPPSRCALRLADLALDTPAYNSGATGVDALWSGLPLLTMAGALGGADRAPAVPAAASSMPAVAVAVAGVRGTGASCDAASGGARRCAGSIFQRNGASLSVAAAQPHTWAHSWADYEALAHAAATRRATRHALRRAAEAGRQRGTLFDTAHWGHGFEAAARGAWEAYAAAGRVMHMQVRAQRYSSL